MPRTKCKINVREAILNHINNNIKDYLIVVIIFIIGLVIGVVYINNSYEVQTGESQEYIKNMISQLKENSNIDKLGLLQESITKNVLFGIFLWFIGLAVISIPIVYLTIAFKGFLLGFTVGSTVIAIRGMESGVVHTMYNIFTKHIIYTFNICTSC